MAKYPREEIHYKKLYKSIDLDRDLEITWPAIEEFAEVVEVDEDMQTFLDEEVDAFDEVDAEFCGNNAIDQSVLIVLLRKLDLNYLEYIFEKLDKVKNEFSNQFCEVCGQKSSKVNHSLITCQGCLLAVHEDCYGITDLVTDRWLCKQCIFYYESPICKLCGRSNGMLKKTTCNNWAHVTCALLIQNASFCNFHIKDQIDISECQKLESTCKICGGCFPFFTNCAYAGCNEFYHASCAAENLYCDIGNSFVYCNEHSPLNKRKRILSKRNVMINHDAYPELTKKVFLRENKLFSKPKVGKYRKIISKSPKVIKNGLSEIADKQTVRIVSKYWKMKRKAIGYYFEDMFIFSNRFLSKE
ncbi:hypothetical protein GINT2_000225 [Glugoides intestinalis]